MSNYLYNTLRLLYMFWLQPISLHDELRKKTQGRFDLLKTNLFSILFQKKKRQALLSQKILLAILTQVVVGNILLVITVICLININGWTTYFSNQGMVIGILCGMILGVILAMVFDIMLGVAFGMASSVTFSIAFGIALAVESNNIALGIVFGTAIGLTLGVTVGAAICIPINIRTVIILSVTVSIVASIIDPTIGIAVGIAIAISLLRLYLIPIWLLWTALQWLRIRVKSPYAKQAFAASAIQLDDLIYFPLPFFEKILIRCMEAVPTQSLNMLALTARSLGQKWSVPHAAVHWVWLMNMEIRDLSALNKVAHTCASVANILEKTSSQAKLGNLLNDFGAVAHALANMKKAHTSNIAYQILDRGHRGLEGLKSRAHMLRRPKLVAVAEHWQGLINNALDIENAPSVVLAGAYQAGSALEAGTTLFRGRDDLFAITHEVYANPQRAETLLLVGQQRMGKSSALMQLPDQLPNAHVVVVDCQHFLSDRGDDMFARGLSAAVAGWERRHPGGVRQVPLAPENVIRQPIPELSRWLESYAGRTRGRRVLLCLDEFDKLVQFVAQERLSSDVLALLRGLSQNPNWMVLYSGQYELDDWIIPYAEYIKNVRRVRISYLREDEARSLLENPVPDFALQWKPDATNAAITLAGCQPFLLQMIGTQVVNHLSVGPRRLVTAADIEVIRPKIFDSGRYYFHSLQNAFNPATNQALHEIALTGQTGAVPKITERLVDYEYIEAIGDNWRFKVPLLREWWEKWTGNSEE